VHARRSRIVKVKLHQIELSPSHRKIGHLCLYQVVSELRLIGEIYSFPSVDCIRLFTYKPRKSQKQLGLGHPSHNPVEPLHDLFSFCFLSFRLHRRVVLVLVSRVFRVSSSGHSSRVAAAPSPLAVTAIPPPPHTSALSSPPSTSAPPAILVAAIGLISSPIRNPTAAGNHDFSLPRPPPPSL
jgi:hypothetical protein